MNYPAIVKQLEIHEGYRKHPYLDSEGVQTVAIGRNLDDVGIDHIEAIYLLERDIDKAVDALSLYVWFERLGDIRQRVVVDMVFNLGIAGFSRFKKTIGHIEAGDYKEAAKEMLDSKWAGQVGVRATRLAEMMKTGIEATI